MNTISGFLSPSRSTTTGAMITAESTQLHLFTGASNFSAVNPPPLQLGSWVLVLGS